MLGLIFFFQELKQRIHQAIFSANSPEVKGKESPPPKNRNLSSDIFHLWLAASPAANKTDLSLQNTRPERDYESLEVRQRNINKRNNTKVLIN